MKKAALCIMTACLLLTTFPMNAAVPNTTKEPSPITAPPANREAEKVKALELRLAEINAMDKSKMNSAEKRKLRKEVKKINHDVHRIGGGVYISAGAIILILILLLVLL